MLLTEVYCGFWLCNDQRRTLFLADGSIKDILHAGLSWDSKGIEDQFGAVWVRD